GKYFKYAIGEILLVVIGILIALQINNWNERRIKGHAEIQFYKNTKQQLLDDVQNLTSQRSYNSKYMNEFNNAIKLIGDNDRSQKDSLGKIAMNITRYSDFDRQGNIYETTVNSGDIKLLRNVEIIDGLRRLEETYMYLNRMESIHFDAIMSMVPDLKQAMRFTTVEVENENMLYTYEFQNLFALSIKIMIEKEEIYDRALSEIDAIISLMENEIEQAK
ncbi:MAG: hypothetical protein HKN96_11460, partial [Flavobacteriaceae bacterium]|nr:hypothetical protein [Flavobacteriaceae bacterium]